MSETDGIRKISGILTSIRKFAIDSAVNISLKGSSGGKRIHKIFLEGLEHQQYPLALNDQKKKCEDCKSDVEPLDAKVEKMQEDRNILKQGGIISTKKFKVSAPSTEFDEESESSVPAIKDRNMVFIRSRL